MSGRYIAKRPGRELLPGQARDFGITLPASVFVVASFLPKNRYPLFGTML
jgi:hypothetical protein